MKFKRKILLSPAFIFALLLLITNDFFLKTQFHNIITGKLSDFSGLFVFSLFWAAFFFNRRKTIFIVTIFLFALWKSNFSQFFIDSFNSVCFFSISRVVDYSDFLALLILPVSYYYLNQLKKKKENTNSHFKKNGVNNNLFCIIKKAAIYPVALFSIFSFCATSYVKSFDFNKTYRFGINNKVLINKFNNLGNHCNNIPLSDNIKNADSLLIHGNDTSYISYNGFTEYYDTVYVYNNLLKKPTNKIDTIYHFKFPKIDTIYIQNSKPFLFSINARKYFEDKNLGYCDCISCNIKISWKNDSSFITLLNIRTSNCYGVFQKIKKGEEEKTLQEAFEKEIINNLNK